MRVGRGMCLYSRSHLKSHVQLREEKVLFSGDHVMGWSTSVIYYMRSLELLLERDDVCYWPTHGPAIGSPQDYVRSFIAHRREREQQLLACLRSGIRRIEAMVPIMYQGLSPQLVPAAARSVYAAMIYLQERGEVKCSGDLRLDDEYSLV